MRSKRCAVLGTPCGAVLTKPTSQRVDFVSSDFTGFTRHAAFYAYLEMGYYYAWHHVPPSTVLAAGTQVGSKFLLFGGADARQQHFADIHCFDAATGKWEKTPVSGAQPCPRSGHSAVAFGESLMVYGGMGVNGEDGVTFNDLFELRPGSTGGMEWVSIPCADSPPRNSHAAVLDGETMIIIGGASPEGQTNEVFTIDLSNRPNLSCRRVCFEPPESETGGAHHSEGPVPTAREMHSACAYNSRGTEAEGATAVLLMGGRSATGVLRDLFSLNTECWTWTRLKDAPVARCAHSACIVGAAGIMAIYGGWDGGTTVADDLHLYELGCGEWTKPQISPRPAGRFAHAACSVDGGGQMLVFGGINPGEDLEDVVMLSTS